MKSVGSTLAYTNDSVLRFFKADAVFKKLKSIHALTKLLGKYGIKVDRIKESPKKTVVCYMIDKDAILDIGIRYRAWTLEEAKQPPFDKKSVTS
jgi:hypothetical protein